MAVLKKPVITEKVTKLAEKEKKATFIVDKEATKASIKNEVEQIYGVKVKAVNTMIVPGKLKKKFTKAGAINGRKPSYKKTIITLAEGHELDFLSGIN